MAEPPGPIPNPEVKRRSADGSGAIGPVRVGRRQVFARPCLSRQGRALFLPGWRTLLDGARCVAGGGLVLDQSIRNAQRVSLQGIFLDTEERRGTEVTEWGVARVGLGYGTTKLAKWTKFEEALGGCGRPRALGGFG